MSTSASVPPPPPLPPSPSEDSVKPMQPHSKVEKNAPRRSLQEMTGKSNFVDAYREAVKIKHNMELTDVELVWAITENWDDILKAKERGEFTQTDLGQMQKFLEERRPELVKPAHASIDFWIEMLEGLLSAHRAFSRIEELLESLALTKPEQFARASTLFQTLSKLPKAASPNWVDPTTKSTTTRVKRKTGTTEGDGTSESLTYIQMHHSFVYTSRGIVLFPEDVVGILSRDMRLFRRFNQDKKLSQKQIIRLKNVVAGFRVCEEEKKVWKAELKIKVLKMKGKSEPEPPVNSLTESGSFMSISEAYHFVGKLAHFYEVHVGPEFDHVRTLLRDIRRELHKELTHALANTDFSVYAPS